MKPKFIVLICFVSIILLVIGGYYVSSYFDNQQKLKDNISTQQTIQTITPVVKPVITPTPAPVQQPTKTKTIYVQPQKVYTPSTPIQMPSIDPITPVYPVLPEVKIPHNYTYKCSTEWGITTCRIVTPN